jgi:hypothetical protein
MMRLTRALFVVAMFALMASLGSDVDARGNLASRPTDLPTLVMDGSLNFSVKEYKIETGLYYRWKIESKGGDEFQLFMPDFFRNVWVNQLVVNDVEFKTSTLYSIEFDDPGVVEVTFVPIRPGRYRYWVAGQEQRGMAGFFVVD